MQEGMSKVLEKRGITHVFSGHPSMGGLFFAENAPTNYRDWKTSDYTFYDTTAAHLHELGILCEPDSREPWFVSAAHDDACLAETVTKFETAVDQTIEKLGR
jgi:glutamate-1-semialdehyde 2,1-aminomutase